MNDQFVMNNYIWNVIFVDRSSPMLIDRTNTRTVATTDPQTFTVYLSNELQGDFLMRVFIHELGHCAMISFGYLDYVRKMVKPEYRIEMEEFICNILADYGLMIFSTAFKTLGYNAWKKIPEEMERSFKRK